MLNDKCGRSVELENHLSVIITAKIGLGKNHQQMLKLKDTVNKVQDIFRASLLSPRLPINFKGKENMCAVEKLNNTLGG